MREDSSKLARTWRSRELERANGRQFQVIVVGAGINGAGVFRELCLQGINCLLVERGDFGSGTSAAPSRLIHGGLKYLETGEFGLVAESARERNLLLRNAPHYVKPLESVVPVHSRFAGTVGAGLRFLRLSSREFERSAIVLRLGLTIYDWLGRHQRVMPRHRYMGRERSHQILPSLREDIVGTAWYYDARVTYAERLNLELVLDGLEANPESLALNYASVTGSSSETLTINDHVSGHTISAKPLVVVNAAGPWIDHVNKTLRQQSRYIGGSKGSHLLIDHPQLHDELNGRMVYFGASDGRICLAYPYFGHVLIGSTDIPVSDPDQIVCDDEEIDYILNEVRKLFPKLRIPRNQVLYHYVGVRPLPLVDTDRPGDIPRSHSLKWDPAGTSRNFPIVSLIGGKWTTFRSFSEETTDSVLDFLARERRCSTIHRAIGGGRDYPQSLDTQQAFITNLQKIVDIGERDAKALLDRYGSRATAVATTIAQLGSDRLKTQPDYFRGEILYLCNADLVCRLVDIIFRRTSLAFSGRLTDETIHELASLTGDAFGWNSHRRAEEIDIAKTEAVGHGITLRKTRDEFGLET